MRKMTDNIRLALLAGAFGYLALYGWGLVLGVFAPAELAIFTVVAVVVAVVLAVHAVRVRREMDVAEHPGHDQVVHQMHGIRERRGF